MMVKADTTLANNQFREGFQEGSYFVDSGSGTPYKVVYNCGKMICSC